MATREELYAAVWTEPLLTLAARYGVSGSYLARVCDSLRVPRPDRGYWAKKAAGRAPPHPALPKPLPGEPTNWEPGGSGPPVRRSMPREQPTRKTATERLKTHGLIQGAMGHFHNTRKVQDGSYLKPYKYNLVDITSTQATLARALAFANALFLALENKGHRVGLLDTLHDRLRRPAIDPMEPPFRRPGCTSYYGLWAPKRMTVVHVGEQQVGLSIVETSESVVMRYVGGHYVREADYAPSRARSRYQADPTWTTTRDVPTGRLRLDAYTPHARVDLAEHWLETASSLLIDRIPTIVAGIEAVVEKQSERVAQAELEMAEELRRLKAEWRQYEIKENKRKTEESFQQSRQQLDAVIRSWAEIKARSEFLENLERDIAGLPESERTPMQTRLALARELIGPTDPMPHFQAWKAPAERYTPKCFEEEE
ncbi:hypothetical protein [Luteimonas sp. MHLX1A]|uniref:hypothetical protein n=1 Tax=Alterluteimonas muca TaxID=2878684 RepID=UPI001E502DBC|nr:hypothetical protein [Luteimonas sp. MHLX1A]MCD9045939.1 hypothetical protein [Luteimonas sp. MHLX1A]